jgi:hypothetical protein
LTDIFLYILKVFFIFDINFCPLSIFEVVYSVVDLHFLEGVFVALLEEVVLELVDVCDPDCTDLKVDVGERRVTVVMKN